MKHEYLHEHSLSILIEKKKQKRDHFIPKCYGASYVDKRDKIVEETVPYLRWLVKMRCVNVLCGWSNMGMPMSVVRPISLKKRGGGGRLIDFGLGLKYGSK